MPAWACMRQSCLPVAVCSACRSPQSCARQCGVARHWERTTPAAGSMWVARQAWPVRVSTQRWCRAARSGAVAIGVALQNGAAAALRGFQFLQRLLDVVLLTQQLLAFFLQYVQEIGRASCRDGV